VAHFQRAMMMDIDQAAKDMRDDEMLEEIEDFLEGTGVRGSMGSGCRLGKASAVGAGCKKVPGCTLTGAYRHSLFPPSWIGCPCRGIRSISRSPPHPSVS
jgi:hypothetical protein